MGPARVVALMQGAGPALAEAGAKALREIAANSDARAQAVFAAGALPLLVRALTDHSDHAGVCQRASGALLNIANRSASRIASVVAAGAVAPLAAAWRNHSGDAREWAQCALSVLGYNDDGSLKRSRGRSD